MKYSLEDISTLFMELLMKNAAYQETAAAIEHILNHPVKISDITRNPLAFSPSYPMDDNEDHRNLYRHVTKDNSASHQSHLTSMLLTGKPVLWAYPYMRRNRYLCGAIYNGHWMGHLTLPDVGQFAEVDLDAVSQCAAMLGLFLWTKGAPRAMNANNGHFLLWSLLNGLVDMEDIRSRVIDPVFDGLSTYQLLWFDGTADQQTLFPFLTGSLKSWWYVSHDGGTVVLTDGSDREGTAKLCAALSNAGITGSISDPFSSLDQVIHQYEITRRTMFFVRQLHAPAGICRYDDYKLPSLVEDARRLLDIRLYEHSLLHTLEVYDAENSTEYYATLKAYLFSHQEAGVTASRLHVHKNTVFYRVNKMKELFQIDFTDGMLTATLITSLMIRERSLKPI
ncbi:MAG: helix-turn-helix domain-containing protein [Clostridia bacterium]|nr:helix-turn-helix domain-containing protein [Clostridia bacterium]